MTSRSPAAGGVLEGRIAMVTGGSRGIGRALSDHLAAAGADLVVLSRTRPPFDQVERIESSKRRLLWVETDLALLNQSDARTIVDHTVSELGAPPDVLVNNAGIIRFEDTSAMALEDWEYVLRVNVTSCLLLCQAVGAMFLARRAGRIINISSFLGFRGGRGVAAYVASKHAVIGLTRALAAEWGPYGVTVNAIAPGDIQTNSGAGADRVSDRITVGRLGKPSDLGDCVVWLASDGASYVNGQTIVIDGGMSVV